MLVCAFVLPSRVLLFNTAKLAMGKTSAVPLAPTLATTPVNLAVLQAAHSTQQVVPMSQYVTELNSRVERNVTEQTSEGKPAQILALTQAF